MAPLNLGNAYFKKGILGEAISAYKKSLALGPRYAKAHYNLSLAYYYRKNYSPAIIHCDKALELGYSVDPKLLKLLTPYR